jgi:hypothetical protein
MKKSFSSSNLTVMQVNAFHITDLIFSHLLLNVSFIETAVGLLEVFLPVPC